MATTGERMVTLFDGTVVSNYSEEWRAECEARTVCRMPRKLDRRLYMQAVEARRGREARDAVESLVRKVWGTE